MQLTLLTTVLFAFTAAAVPAPAPTVSYDGVKVVRVPAADLRTTNKIAEIINTLSLAKWTSSIQPGHAIDFEVPADKLAAFEASIKGTAYEVMHEDLGASIANESSPSPAATERSVLRTVDLSWFNSYHTFAEHQTFLRTLASQYPNNARIFTAGTSSQNRPLLGIHIFGTSGPSINPASIFHGTTHAREWITTTTTEYLAYTLLSTYANTTATRRLVDANDFYILPVVNPDGFVYTQTQDRMWRKNRQRDPTTGCTGTDTNRNWAAHWATPGGASTDPCDETYRGATPHSAPEVAALASWQQGVVARQGGRLYVDFHAYGQLLMHPYGWSCLRQDYSPDNEELLRVGRGAAEALRGVHGTRYTVGPICETVYPATGGSVDWAYDQTGVRYAYTYELRDTGRYGFVLPKEQIRAVGEETWASVRWMMENMK